MKIEVLVSFRLTENVLLNPGRPEGLVFDLSEDMAFRLVPRDPIKDPCGSFGGLKCCVISSRCVSSFGYDFVKALTQENRYIEWVGMPYILPYAKHGHLCIDEHGLMQPGFRPSFEGLPVELQNVCDNVTMKAQEAAERFFGLLRWTQKDDTPFKVVADAWPYWRVSDEGEFHGVGLKRQEQTIESTGGIKWANADQELLESVWKREKNEPLAHELWREGWYLTKSSPRTALLMLATALETGVKRHISYLEPNAKWLMSNLPSPPVHKIYKDYLPLLYSDKGIACDHWQSLDGLFKSLQKIYEARNELAHGKVDTTRPIPILYEWFEAGRDLLYILDVMAGEHWARGNVSHTVRCRLGWPPPINERLMIKVLSHDL